MCPRNPGNSTPTCSRVTATHSSSEDRLYKTPSLMRHPCRPRMRGLTLRSRRRPTAGRASAQTLRRTRGTINDCSSNSHRRECRNSSRAWHFAPGVHLQRGAPLPSRRVAHRENEGGIAAHLSPNLRLASQPWLSRKSQPWRHAVRVRLPLLRGPGCAILLRVAFPRWLGLRLRRHHDLARQALLVFACHSAAWPQRRSSMRRESQQVRPNPSLEWTCQGSG